MCGDGNHPERHATPRTSPRCLLIGTVFKLKDEINNVYNPY
jgi:hypothetical protein